MKLQDIQILYFIGIGGIGMSALARYFNHRGIKIYGYDKTETTLTKKLVEEGMIIHYDEDLAAIPDGVDLVIYTPAVPSDHSELKYFKANNYPIKKRAQVLGMISEDRKTIGIAGTHGKTSTSSILTFILRTGGVDCAAFLGGIVKDFESNFVDGESDWVVVEADEFDRSFLHLHPDIATILSMDADHLDIYGSLEQIHEGFSAYSNQVKNGGIVFLKDGLPLKTAKRNVVTYGIETGICRSQNIRVEDGFFIFDYRSPAEDINDIRFTMPGRHNIENATVAIAIAQELGVKGESIKKALASFKGIKRRFEFIHRSKKVVYINDYAHHPSELEAAIDAARELYPNRKITGVFQPHLYSRTRDFVDGFAKSLDALDEILLMDIYPARELPIEGVSSKMIFDKMENQNKKMVNKANLLDHIKNLELDLLLTLGAGDINTFVPTIKNFLITDEKYRTERHD